MNIQLVENASAWWRMYSNWVFMFISAMGVVQTFMPFLSWLLPDWMLGVLLFLIGLAGIAARLIKQFNLAPAGEVLLDVGEDSRNVP
ncbi:hypothetical protein C7T35_01465 [Variovorax sp. WS11]|uniref:DUF7940 domain-containing protein n=1 Tax=Variovorax sp. WS11 TaxID=1105204 RepID=UPI000D0E072D|nr:hypothetical protein [Variovorax sp. WS11]NDZ11478.1 hypothetical protein [Variovorax sp. WS11]PSL86663.1 hypothetical protein C7T35_01465 [Variovorax sp. WS11]